MAILFISIHNGTATDGLQVIVFYCHRGRGEMPEVNEALYRVVHSSIHSVIP